MKYMIIFACIYIHYFTFQLKVCKEFYCVLHPKICFASHLLCITNMHETKRIINVMWLVYLIFLVLLETAAGVNVRSIWDSSILPLVGLSDLWIWAVPGSSDLLIWGVPGSVMSSSSPERRILIIWQKNISNCKGGFELQKMPDLVW